MKAIILLLLTVALTFVAVAQQIVPKPAELIRRNRLNPPRISGVHRLADRGARIDIRTLNNPRLLAGFVQANRSRQPIAAKPAGQPARARSRILGATCNNRSFFHLIGLTNSVVYAGAMTHTQDDGVIMSGSIWDSTAAHPEWQINAYVLKCDNLGNILWVNILNDLSNDPTYDFNPMLLKEMPGGDILLAATVDDDTSAYGVTTLYKLTASGATTWHKEFKSVEMLWDNNEGAVFTVKDINPGLNGDFILSGTTVASNYGAQSLTVMRLDAGGNYIWDQNMTNRGDYNLDAEGLNAYLSGNQIMAIGISHGDEFPYGNDAIFFATLDYATGAVQNKRFWVHSTPVFSKSPLDYYDYAVQLNTGNYLVYYMPFSSYMQIPDTVDYVGVEEYNPSGNFLMAYNLSAAYYTPNENNFIYFDNNGDGYISIPSYINSATEAVFYSTIRHNQIVRQRIQTYTNGVSGDYVTNARFMNDGACMVNTGYYDPASGSWLGLKKLYDTDTISTCLGRDTFVLMKLPFSRIENPAYPYLDPPVTGQIVPAAYGLGPTPIAYHTKNGCINNSFCAMLQIQGQTAICGAGKTLQYLAARNPGCGAIPIWTIDSSAVTNLVQINDTTVNVTFKDTTWNGMLHADILDGSCSTGLGDSVALHMIGTPRAPNFAADTTLCNGNTIVLHPGPVYSSYVWQDGSTDSTYTVTTPGTYSVAVTDACGDAYHASTQVIQANFPFTAGPAVAKCNQDSVILKATGGFTNYQWAAANIPQPSITDSVIAVDPLQNTTYTVTADKWPGCAVNASVQITVETSPAVRLGGDTSFCSGSSKLLDAGPGFTAYAWNTGATSEQITVSLAGAYEVTATAADGCTSKDTFEVTTVFPTPQFSLGSTADSTICYNQPIIYSFPSDGDLYRWSDGRLGSGRMIDTGGTYGLTVTNSYGCSTDHSITVTVNPLPLVRIGADTTLCQGADIVLNASNRVANGSYLWQDGSTGAEYTVSSAGTYSVRVTAADGCSTADSIQVSFIGAPVFTLGEDTGLCPGMTFTLRPSLAYAGNYIWQDGSTLDYMVVKDTGWYSLTAGNVCGMAKGAIHVTAGLCALAMPNAFTPNGDGKNDLFRVRYPFSVSRFTMAVYDRWGRCVFHSTNIDDGWDGTIQGSPAPPGTYVWYITLTDFRHKDQFQKGTVILIR